MNKVLNSFIGFIVLAGFLCIANVCLGVTLITPEEAARPDKPVVTSRGIDILQSGDDGPVVRILAPKQYETLQTPVGMEVVFEATPDKTIDYETLTIKYLKLISIDITDRLKPFLKNNRLLATGVCVPQGKHRLQLSIAYVSGEKTTMDIVLKVDR
ncbi:MAG: hypothetical protein NT178_16300 [Proteobacteria bacterium]|nr:hypothetical protein [Pseudomonadota bacterium]